MTDRFPDDDLEALWREQPADLTVPDMKELTMNIRQQHQQEQRRLLFLNVREVTPAVLLFAWFGWNGIQATSRSWAYLTAAALVLGVGAFLAGTSLLQRRREQELGDTTLGQLEKALSQAKHRAWLYRSILWWYVAPLACAIGLVLVARGRDFTTPSTIVYLGVAAGSGATIYAFNRKIGRDKYEPQVEHLSRLIADMT